MDGPRRKVSTLHDIICRRIGGAHGSRECATRWRYPSIEIRESDGFREGSIHPTLTWEKGDRMKRREFLGSVATGLLLGNRAFAQAKIRRIGYLSAGSPATNDSPTVRPVIEGLKRRGWIEGSTIQFERRAANGDAARLPSLVTELVAAGVEAILTLGFPAVAACKGASVPAIASGAGDLVSLGLVESFRHPGGNITGISDLAGELAPKRLAIL